VIITLGLTESDLDRGYSSFSDGYRLGARQISVTVALEGDGTRLSGEQWAEAVFVASNHPGRSRDPIVAAIQQALADQVHGRLRSVSVGDTVTAHGQMWACDPAGWHQVGTRQIDDLYH
jgi:hypothetical protein